MPWHRCRRYVRKLPARSQKGRKRRQHSRRSGMMLVFLQIVVAACMILRSIVSYLSERDLSNFYMEATPFSSFTSQICSFHPCICARSSGPKSGRIDYNHMRREPTCTTDLADLQSVVDAEVSVAPDAQGAGLWHRMALQMAYSIRGKVGQLRAIITSAWSDHRIHIWVPRAHTHLFRPSLEQPRTEYFSINLLRLNSECAKAQPSSHCI